MNIHPSQKKKKKKKTAMVRQDWAKCNDDVRQVAGVCSSWLRGRDSSMTLESFQNLWCHNGVLASIRTVQSGSADLCFSTHMCHDMTGLS